MFFEGRKHNTQIPTGILHRYVLFINVYFYLVCTITHDGQTLLQTCQHRDIPFNLDWGARLSEWRKNAKSTEDRKKVMQAKADHVAGVFADRGCARRLMLASESAAREDLQLPRDKSCLYISIDGMDQAWDIQIKSVSMLKLEIGYNLITVMPPWQAKYKVPRNLSSSKEFSTAYRPSLHLVGAVCHGVCEIYFLCHADLRKDSNQNISLLCL